MAAADRTNNTEQQQRFINNLWQHQQKNEFCDFTLTTNDTSIECHKLVLSSASSYFSELLCDSEHVADTIDFTPLPEHILRTVVAFMYNSEYVIDDDNVIELLKLSGTWNLDILAKLCVEYMNDNITINNACRFYNLAIDNVGYNKSHIINRFIREHFTTLHESGRLNELSLKNFTTIIEHDEINVKSEDVIFSSAVQIINHRTSVEDINRCLELIRFPHTSGDFLVNVILKHPLMKFPSRHKYASQAILHQINKTSKPEVKPPRYWGKGICCIGRDRCMYQYVSTAGNNEFVKKMNLPELVDDGSVVDSHRERVVIVGGWNNSIGDKRAILLDMTDSTNVHLTRLPDLPEPCSGSGIVLSDNDVYVVGGYTNNSGCLRAVYYLSLGSDAWQTKTSMPKKVFLPLVTQHQQCIYVLGGNNDNHNKQSSVSQYNIKDNTWKRCKDMPVACGSDAAGIVIHEGRIKVFTDDKCLIYADDTDTWIVKQYNRIGYAVNAFVEKEQVCAVVWNGDTYSMMSYDDVDDGWNSDHEKIDNVWHTGLFC